MHELRDRNQPCLLKATMLPGVTNNLKLSKFISIWSIELTYIYVYYVSFTGHIATIHHVLLSILEKDTKELFENTLQSCFRNKDKIRGIYISKVLLENSVWIWFSRAFCKFLCFFCLMFCVSIVSCVPIFLFLKSVYVLCSIFKYVYIQYIVSTKH